MDILLPDKFNIICKNYLASEGDGGIVSNIQCKRKIIRTEQ